MIGNISFGISFENGKRRVPIPPAVIKAVYPSKPFDDPVPSVQDLPEFRPSKVIRSENDFLLLPDVPQVLRTRSRSGGPLAIAKNPPGPRPRAECASERIRKSVREPALPIRRIAGSL